MLIFRFILLFGVPSRTALHTLISKKHINCHIWCITAASLFKLCLERSVSDTDTILTSLLRVAHVH